MHEPIVFESIVTGVNVSQYGIIFPLHFVSVNTSEMQNNWEGRECMIRL